MFFAYFMAFARLVIAGGVESLGGVSFVIDQGEVELLAVEVGTSHLHPDLVALLRLAFASAPGLYP